ncbi:MAG: hypothetical protein M1140_04850, partial [Chloroflexi bacterium]|nr:hypothetical protein [Chloroflexota bacterium]
MKTPGFSQKPGVCYNFTMSPPSPIKLAAPLRLLLIACTAAWVLVLFVKPDSGHAGINYYYRARFLDMVNGTAWNPFVSRALLPATVRAVTAAIPQNLQHGVGNVVTRDASLSAAFETLGWETSAATTYLV